MNDLPIRLFKDAKAWESPGSKRITHAAIERAKEKGQCESAYYSRRTASVPEDLEAALAKSAKAGRIEQIVDMLKKGETFH